MRYTLHTTGKVNFESQPIRCGLPPALPIVGFRVEITVNALSNGLVMLVEDVVATVQRIARTLYQPTCEEIADAACDYFRWRWVNTGRLMRVNVKVSSGDKWIHFAECEWTANARR